MDKIGKVIKVCPCCMEQHEVFVVREKEMNLFKGKQVEYYAIYEYCDVCDMFNQTEEMIDTNDIAMKDQYRLDIGLLTSKEILDIRTKYGISQSDLAALLNWGAKTITRYESHNVQDAAHDAILRKLDNDPQWFLELLGKSKERLSPTAYDKYYAKAVTLFERNKDVYLRRAIEARYAIYDMAPDYCGNTKLNIDKIVDVIRYYANSIKVTSLYKVKLMKLLWYADMLSFKRFGHSMMGLVYASFPMGALPIAHETIIDLHGVNCETIDFDNSTAYLFKPTKDKTYDYLNKDDIAVLDTIIAYFGCYSKDQIVNKMHSEVAYIETARGDIISYDYALKLSIN